MNKKNPFRSKQDLFRAISTISEHFGCSQIVVVGSQAILPTWNGGESLLTQSPEIDMYPVDVHKWKQKNPDVEISEEINALFGDGSQFHQTHGFYIDGVDETTAKLPENWEDRANVYSIEAYGKQVKVIVPHMDDIIVSKLLALREKDK
jgi:hypothetical protein